MSTELTMAGAKVLGRNASRDVERYLRSQKNTIAVLNVEHDEQYQQKVDIDFIWTTKQRTYTVEVKGDRNHATGNFFFETVSNTQLGTEGCFLYTIADLLFYYFVDVKKLYILPMPATRNWFLENIERFPIGYGTTVVNNDKYRSEGRLVPIATVCNEVEGVYVVTLK